MSDRRTLTYAGFAAAVAVAGLAGMYLLGRPSAQEACGQTKVAGEAEIGGPFTLISETGETVTDADVLTKPSLVYFGYTFCPDVCPYDTVRNAEAADLLAEMGLDVQTVFISVDPGRDTPEALRDFTDYVDEGMLGLTGSEEQIEAAAKAYKAYYKVHEPEEEGDQFYLVDHSTFTYLMLPETGFAEFYRREATPEKIAESVACFLGAN